jgi:hypothetical protein
VRQWRRMRGTRAALVVVAAAVALAACATTPKSAPARSPASTLAPGPTAGPGEDPEVPPRPADADADVAYYRERAAALASETFTEIARTNFARMRRGRLYLPPEAGGADSTDFETALTEAFNSGNNEAILTVTSKSLPGDQADIRAHMLRAVALRRLGREKEANFHRELAIGLIQSIVQTGDGRSFETAWTVFRVKEEYEVLKAGGYLVEQQALTAHGGRRFDILDARKPDGSAKFRAHFDITELFAEEGRAFRGR